MSRKQPFPTPTGRPDDRESRGGSTTSGARRVTGINLGEAQLQALDRIIAIRMLRGEGRTSRSEIIRQIVNEALPKLLQELGDDVDKVTGL